MIILDREQEVFILNKFLVLMKKKIPVNKLKICMPETEQ